MEDIILDTLAAVACIIGFLNLTERKERENWTDPFLVTKDYSEYHTVMEQLRHHNDSRRFKKFLRVSPEMFDYIVNRVGPTIERKNTRFRRAIYTSRTASGNCIKICSYW